MTRLMTSTALTLGLTLAAGGAAAEAHTESFDTTSGVVSADNYANTLRAENLIGEELYTIGAEYEEESWLDPNAYVEVEAEWENIGEIEDIVMSRDGELIGLVVETGGWLDIGDEEVIIDFKDVRIVGEYGMGDFDVVTRMSQEMLEQMPEADEGYWN
ncbi:PRC-barrel domain-containing protein [Limimaricola pyoseonensis]|uniref:PRC-barrel domain-containing protein n=1 Tax=Limimaricola pyoseonensis TaxID=521013 RepID=A0A1G7A470_9RHOB|nr:PRC-barrel domain-containing protein [Limimaricola pyoseonensis]SDE09718.1 PRC-barrel domain-containing protein [Limimaricola pyoseonensis]